jgi:dephospho-CoA kinase
VTDVRHDPGGSAAEREVLRTRPGAAFVVLHRWPGLVPGLVLLAAYFFLRGSMLPPWPRGILIAAIACLGLRLAWMTAAWLSRRYTLTDRRLTVRAGVVRRVMAEVPLRNVQHVTMTRSAAERIFGLGTIGLATAGSDGAAIHWLMVPRPEGVLAAIREQVDRAQGDAPSPSQRLPAAPGLTVSELARRGGSHPSHPSHASHQSHQPAPRPLIIGLAGAIGAGKSEVARALARLGCVLTDSDEQARLVLERPEVRRTLVEWWGEGVLGTDRRVDRSAIAKIVFADAEQRRRLEALVHPLIKAARAELVARAGNAPAVVVDAPLLFEAGVDLECDSVIFVDAPRELRLRRVRIARGWDEAELARREAAQWAPEDKRRRSHEAIVNDGSPEELGERVSAALERILARGRARS